MGEIFVFIKNLFKYNRNVDADMENIWDLMICGKAADAKAHQSHTIVNIITYVVTLGICYLLFALFLRSGFNNGVMFVMPFVFETVAYAVCRCLPVSMKVKLIINLIAAVVLGLVFGLISLAF